MDDVERCECCERYRLLVERYRRPLPDGGRTWQERARMLKVKLVDAEQQLAGAVKENERLRRMAAAALERTQVDDSGEATMILEQVVTLDGKYVPPPTEGQ